MTLEPLLAASWAIQLHTLAALAAFVIGGVQLLRHKGGAAHRWTGRVWCGLMMVIAASSFFIHNIRQWQGFSVIHLLSIWVLFAVPLAIFYARQGRIAAHRKTMIGLYVGALVIAGVFTLLPGRIMYKVVFGA
jgi:uncharacterized membrane protein